ncbi:glyoxylase-like metal-dependent hydrolase (beta-lactamase superfamily II) [Sphingobium fontiphilum]|uniref:Glyoxylase-like metal-dependent hydrolase (Beta-lactamase superfamily II) n=2 Tax=Sphingobium fontiphilum TaxID=944425 RepID=A0A7W6DH61_9SPHN|nr:glyoxylase-like metal-dependent hydrolase (beta-lactamase superfamily II) [Sphingobium fontiphilum]
MALMATPPDPADMPTGLLMPCSPLVARVLAPNPSPFTYTGTQSYLVGVSDVAVIDPGPDDDAHIDALVAAIAGRRVAAILCTHTHRDHSPAAAPLAALTGAPVIGCAPLTLDDDGPRADAAFDADYRPDDVLADCGMVAGEGWSLSAVATPGHTSNHLCFALEQEGALFTGDHVMGWSTSVISPPDGDMTAYMASMGKLLEREEDRVYYAAHGDPIDNPRRLVRGMMGHRKQREGQILRFLERNGASMIPDMVVEMYRGVDPRLHGAAGRSVLAHLLDLRGRGVAQPLDDGRWRLG